MKYVRSVLLAATAVGLLAFPASAQTIATMDGHYYRLVPLKGAPRYRAEVATVIPAESTASVPQSSSCHLVDWAQREAPDNMYVSACGPE
jgi:hypothetical protein